MASLPIVEAALGLEANWSIGPASKPAVDRSYRQLSFTPEDAGLQLYSVAHVEQPWRTARAPGDLTISWTGRSRALAADGWNAAAVLFTEARSRSSMATAYLRPALKRSNLVVETGASATRIELDGTRATGITYMRESPRNAVARRDVILAGGVINSPQLMLSGIGAPEEHAEHGLEVQIPLPGVGRNLSDHMSVVLMFHRRTPGPFFRMMRADRIMLDFVRTWFGGEGFSGEVPGGIVAFLKSSPEHPLPDLQLLFTAAPLAAWPHLSPFKAPFRDGFAMRVVAVQPQSRGHVALASADPDAAPRIHQNFLSAEADWRSLRTAFGIARNLAASPAMAGYIEREFFPGPDCDDAGAMDARIRKTSIIVHHPAGTSRMGGEADPGSVVDSRLRVRGQRGCALSTPR